MSQLKYTENYVTEQGLNTKLLHTMEAATHNETTLTKSSP